MDRVKRIWYLSPMRAAKVQASLRIRAVSPEPPLLAHTNSESRGTFRQKARSLAFLNGWACAVKLCNDGMLEDTNSLDRAHIISSVIKSMFYYYCWYTASEKLFVTCTKLAPNWKISFLVILRDKSYWITYIISRTCNDTLKIAPDCMQEILF